MTPNEQNKEQQGGLERTQPADEAMDKEISEVLDSQSQQVEKLTKAQETKEVDPKVMDGIAVYVDAIDRHIPDQYSFKTKISQDLSKKMNLGSDTSVKISNLSGVSANPENKSVYLTIDLRSVLTQSDDRNFAQNEWYDPAKDEAVLVWIQNIGVVIDYDKKSKKPLIREISTKVHSTCTRVQDYNPNTYGGLFPSNKDENIIGSSITNSDKGPYIDEQKLLLLLNEAVQEMLN